MYIHLPNDRITNTQVLQLGPTAFLKKFMGCQRKKFDATKHKRQKGNGAQDPLTPEDFCVRTFYKRYRILQELSAEIEAYRDKERIEGRTYLKLCRIFHKYMTPIFNGGPPDFLLGPKYVTAQICRATFMHYKVRWDSYLTLEDLWYVQPDGKLDEEFLCLPCDVVRELFGLDPRLAGCHWCMGRKYLKAAAKAAK